MTSRWLLNRRIRAIGIFLILFGILGLFSGDEAAPEEPVPEVSIIEQFLKLPVAEGDAWLSAYTHIEQKWQDAFIPMVLEVIFVEEEPAFSVPLIQLLTEKTGKEFGFDHYKWFEWLWNQEPRFHPDYADFKAGLYGRIDPKFNRYFSSKRTSKIRLDEVMWGGVRQDGIPPLRQPDMITADDVDYLDDDNIVFGIAVSGDARAYPKRILAWHEMFVDDVGGVPMAGVYCTLCGSMILYKTVHNGTNHSLGTSGFLYRSNKLMYDKKTQSLWNTLWGVPVIGPLAEKNIKLDRMSVVTTTWGEWRRRHPKTKVLSLKTGHARDYSEGAAYRSYFATDRLMFPVPLLDNRLKNKDEVLGLLLSPYQDKPMAISINFLGKNPLYHGQIEDLNFVALTDKSSAVRVYETKKIRFSKWDQNRTVVDNNNIVWQLTESKLTAPDGQVLYRLPAHRAFWFGWYSAYSHTKLIN